MMRYTCPVTGEELDVDATLDPAVLDRLNRIPDITIVETCAGHAGEAPGVAYLALVAPHDFAVSIVIAAARDRIAAKILLRPDPDDFPYRTWVVMEAATSECPAWWERVVQFVEGGSGSRPGPSPQEAPRDH
jgi:hypothetical protein